MTIEKPKTSMKYDFPPCPEHGYTNPIHNYETGEDVCGLCGLVLSEQMLDKGPEWRAFTDEEKAKRSRVGNPTSYAIHDKGLSTTMRVDRDAYGHRLKLSGDDPRQMYRLRKWQIRYRVHSSEDRNLAYAMTELDRLSDKTYIPPPIKEKAAVIYRKALDKNLIRGRSIATIAAAAIYAACRASGTPRTLQEIAEASLVDKKDVGRVYRLLIRELEYKIPIQNPAMFFNKLGLSGYAEGIAAKILVAAKKIKLTSGRGPTGIAAAAAYIGSIQACERKTQKDIAEAAGVTEVTVRNRSHELEEKLMFTITL